MASHGILTACPTHPGSDRDWVDEYLQAGNKNIFGDVEATFGPRPGDLSRIIDWLLEESPWTARVDSGKIAAMGHCMGATTALTMAGLNVNMPGEPNKTYIDGRVRAVAGLGPQVGQERDEGLHEDSWSTVEVPTLIITGTDDFYWVQDIDENPDILRLPYDQITGLKCLTSLQGAQHHAFTDSEPYYRAGLRNPNHHAWIKALVLAFLRAVLDGDEEAAAWWICHSLSDEQPGGLNQEHENWPLAIRSADLTITDEDRGMSFQVRATYPAAHGTFPVILFSPFMAGTRDHYQPLVRNWASSGFITIVADHEGTPNRELITVDDTLATWRSRAEDLIEILDDLPESSLGSIADLNRVGAGGHLIGALAASLTAGAERQTREGTVTLDDERIGALMLMSPQGVGQGMTETSWIPVDVSMLVTTGTFDHSARTGNMAEWRTEPYYYSDGPDDRLAWVDGLRTDYDGLGETKPLDHPGTIALDLLVLTTSFWRAAFFPDPAADRRLEPEAWSGDSAITLSHKTGEAADTLYHGPFEAAAAYSNMHNGAAVLVMQNGQIVFEQYASDVTADTTFHIQSGTKGFWGPVIAAMIDDGLITSFDEPAAETLTEWNSHQLKKTITLRHLLQLNAGLAQDIVNLQGHDRPTLASDLYAHAVSVPLMDVPGMQFSYGPVCYYVLGKIMKRKLADLAETPLEYLKRRLLTPMGIETGHWVHDESGNPHIPNGAWISARNWALFGQFMLRDGRWEGEQLVTASLMRMLREPSEPNAGHGLAIWLNTPGGASYVGKQKHVDSDPDSAGGFIYPGGDPDLFAALGGGKNRMYIVPSCSLVAVRQTRGSTDGFEDSAFVRLLLDDIETSIPDGALDLTIPDRIRLLPNYPNPFNPSTALVVYLDQPCMTEMTVYDIRGRRLKTLIHDWLDAGIHHVHWEGRDELDRPVTSGIYLCVLRAGGQIRTRKMLLVK